MKMRKIHVVEEDAWSYKQISKENCENCYYIYEVRNQNLLSISFVLLTD